MKIEKAIANFKKFNYFVETIRNIVYVPACLGVSRITPLLSSRMHALINRPVPDEMAYTRVHS